MLSQNTDLLENLLFALLVAKLPAVNVCIDTNPQSSTPCVILYNSFQAKWESVRPHTELPINTHCHLTATSSSVQLTGSRSNSKMQMIQVLIKHNDMKEHERVEAGHQAF